MKIVDENYTEPEEESTLIQAMLDALEASGVDTDAPAGQFFIVQETEDSMTFVSNETNPADVLMMLEIVKAALIGGRE